MHRIAIFASGAGSNARKIIDHFKGHASISVDLIVCNNAGAGVLHIAANKNVSTLLLEKERFFRGDGYVNVLSREGISFIVLAGFLWKLPPILIQAYAHKIINIHPALLPKYGGKGMYGNIVHEAVLTAGEKYSGITIHYVDDEYDHGNIIFQTSCPVDKQDTPESLAQKVHQLEHENYARVIEELLK